MSLTLRPQIWCTSCGMCLEYFYSKENKTFLVAHFSNKKDRDTNTCPEAKKVYKVPIITLEETV